MRTKPPSPGVTQAIETLLLNRHDSEEQDFTVGSQADQIETISEVTDTISLFFGSGGGHLAAGGRHWHHEHHAGVRHRADP